jgi:hypothetical protein
MSHENRKKDTRGRFKTCFEDESEDFCFAGKEQNRRHIGRYGEILRRSPVNKKIACSPN